MLRNCSLETLHLYIKSPGLELTPILAKGDYRGACPGVAEAGVPFLLLAPCLKKGGSPFCEHIVPGVLTAVCEEGVFQIIGLHLGAGTQDKIGKLDTAAELLLLDQLPDFWKRCLWGKAKKDRQNIGVKRGMQRVCGIGVKPQSFVEKCGVKGLGQGAERLSQGTPRRSARASAQQWAPT